MIIAIDGPAASGKSTVARAVARKLGATYVDTGAMYRALTWKALRTGVDVEDEGALVAMAESTEIDFERPDGELARLVMDDSDVTEEIRRPEVSASVSAVSRVPGVRAELVKKQRSFREAGRDLVVEGRDISTVVFPDAELKVYLTASVEERARRRHKELVDKGYDVGIERVEKDIRERDCLDSTRETSPLTVAPDAIILDTTDKTIDMVVAEIAGQAEGRR